MFVLYNCCCRSGCWQPTEDTRWSRFGGGKALSSTRCTRADFVSENQTLGTTSATAGEQFPSTDVCAIRCLQHGSGTRARRSTCVGPGTQCTRPLERQFDSKNKRRNETPKIFCYFSETSTRLDTKPRLVSCLALPAIAAIGRYATREKSTTAERITIPCHGMDTLFENRTFFAV